MKKYGSQSNKDYSDVVRDLEQGKEPRRLDDLIDRVTRSLTLWAEISYADAQEYVYRAFEEVLIKIRQGKIRHPEVIMHYLWMSSRNKFFRDTDDRETPIDEILLKEDPPEIELPYKDNRRRRKLYNTILQMSPRKREMAWYLLDNPEDPNEEIARALDLTPVNCRVLKIRTLNELQKNLCE